MYICLLYFYILCLLFVLLLLKNSCTNFVVLIFRIKIIKINKIMHGLTANKYKFYCYIRLHVHTQNDMVINKETTYTRSLPIHQSSSISLVFFILILIVIILHLRSSLLQYGKNLHTKIWSPKKSVPFVLLLLIYYRAGSFGSGGNLGSNQIASPLILFDSPRVPTYAPLLIVGDKLKSCSLA